MDKIKTNFAGQTVYVGMDIHKASWNLGIHLNDMFVTISGRVTFPLYSIC